MGNAACVACYQEEARFRDPGPAESPLWRPLHRWWHRRRPRVPASDDLDWW